MNRKEARERAIKLVDRMTLEEKASQLRFGADAIERLGVPAYNWWNEALHGVARAGTATVFPQAIALAAAFDEEMMEEIGDCIATEGRAKYNVQSAYGDRDIYKGITFWSPNVNIFRDPRWGRGHETYGEDPYLTSRLGVRFIEGLQGDGEYMKAAACAKHFAVHSGPEAERHHFNAIASRKDMEETYLPAFEACVKEAGVEAVMGAYNRTNGEPCCASSDLIGHYLRGEWGFEGHFVSDCWAVRDFHEEHKVTSRPEESVKLALEAGCDLNCGCTYERILNAVEEGLLDEKYITESCVRLFTTRFLLGMFDETEYDAIPYTEVEAPGHIALSHRAASEGMVLLKNNGILPLKAGACRTIGVIGPNADSRAALVGNYHGTSSEYITVLEGIRRVAGEGTRILYSQGCHLWKDNDEALADPAGGDRLAEAQAVCDNADVVILVIGLDETLEGEEGDTGNADASGDKLSLLYPAPQRRLMTQVLSCGKPVIVISMTGSAMDLREADEKADAILQAWYPGARGGLDTAQILFGQKAPGGKLPVTFYRTTDDLPAFEDYAMTNRTYRYFTGTPLYPFGYGLTYGKAAVTGAEVSPARTLDFGREEGDGALVRVTVENTGDIPVGEVLQIYVKDLECPFAVPFPALAWFGRIALAPGEKKTIEACLAPRAFTSVEESGKRVDGSGRYAIYAGFSQPDERSLALTGAPCVRILFDK